MKKHIFFDVDGTLIPFGGTRPESARKALIKAHDEGHNIYLATGRGEKEVDIDLQSLPFSGGVFSAGAVCVYEGEKIVTHKLSVDELKELYALAKELDLHYLIQSVDYTVMTKEFKEIFFNIFSEANGRAIEFPNFKLVDEYPLDLDIMKMVVFSQKGEIAKVKSILESKYDVVPNSFGVSQDVFAEISIKNITKASGFLEMVKHLGIAIEDTYFFGDETNDLEIAKVVGTSIALGNACDALKEIASYITSDINCHGIKNALEHFNLITATNPTK